MRDLVHVLARDVCVTIIDLPNLWDEPVGSIDPVLCHQIFSHVLRLRDELGLTFLVIEHRLEVAAQYADHVFAMDRGKLVTEGTAEEVFEDERVIKAYLGE